MCNALPPAASIHHFRLASNPLKNTQVMAGFIPFLLDAAPTRAALMLLPLCFRTWRKPSLVFIALCFLFTAIGCSRPRPSVEVREWEVLSRVVEPMITVDPSRQRSKHTEDVQSELQKKGMRLI